MSQTVDGAAPTSRNYMAEALRELDDFLGEGSATATSVHVVAASSEIPRSTTLPGSRWGGNAMYWDVVTAKASAL